tara:strand:+ start:6272 stop:7237 length:966 start_codon:yes stop_codon:yes gene_type:complete
MNDPVMRFTGDMTAQLSQRSHSSQDNPQKPSVDKIKLIIHAGTPKTGTTSIQTYLSKKQRKLRGKGILYPHNLEASNNPAAPAHQWFEKNLVTTHVDNFMVNMSNVISQIKDDTHTIILSSEGIYNYWWDFPDASKALLLELATLFDIHVWVWFREPVAFIESYYKQCIRNPQVASNPCYGQNLSLADMLEVKWFSQHLDYQGFVNDCKAIFGQKSVSAFEYNGDVVQQVSQLLGLATAHDNPTPRQNNSLNNASISLLRVINQYDVKAKDKERLMPYLKEINSIMDAYVDTNVRGKEVVSSLIDEVTKKRIMALATPVND